MWGEEMERSPVLAAPGSNNYSWSHCRIDQCREWFGGHVIFKGSPMKTQTISARNTCRSHTRSPGNTEDRGIDLDELSSASLAGLVLASRKYRSSASGRSAYMPDSGSRGNQSVFKPREDALAIKKPKNAKAPDNYRSRAL